MTANVFAVSVFFIVFRECLETSIIVSVLLAFLKQTLGKESEAAAHRSLLRQVWAGVGLGFIICLCIGAGMIAAWYTVGKDHFAKTEDIWEGTFGLLASLIITIMGAALLRVNKMQDKWRVKLAKAFEARRTPANSTSSGFKRWCEKYAMFLLPFVTVLREGLEAVVYIGGVALGLPAESFPLAVICGLAAGCAIGYLLYRSGNSTSLQLFLIISTCALYLVAAGLFSKAVWYFENDKWNKVIGGDASETGSGPGSYDIRKSVWHVNCCNPEMNGGGGWGIFNSIFGWQNSATYGSVISYNLYWLVIIVVFVTMRFKERNGHYPLLKSSAKASQDSGSDHFERKEGLVETNGKVSDAAPEVKEVGV
ncbi:high-affinity iron ion transporter FtrA [Phyllosticta citricarpa]|uniref:High-affinity iron ion transporter FtrA n=1 Tax=Phyllosticta citricarpa TaxID=55181 RepID=A0ABR1LRQ2_9PEZI